VKGVRSRSSHVRRDPSRGAYSQLSVSRVWVLVSVRRLDLGAPDPLGFVKDTCPELTG
jgi:hypothetical protein